jgi:hypothetical protein
MYVDLVAVVHKFFFSHHFSSWHFKMCVDRLVADHTTSRNLNANRSPQLSLRPHDLDLRVTKMYHSPTAHAGCRGDHCKAMDWTEPIICSSPRLPPTTGRLTLVVDDTRFVVDVDLLKAKPETMLGRWVVTLLCSFPCFAMFNHDFAVSLMIGDCSLNYCTFFFS